MLLLQFLNVHIAYSTDFHITYSEQSVFKQQFF